MGALFISLSTAFAEPARIDQIKGIVEKRGPGMLSWEKVTPGEKISEGTSLRTAENSMAEVVTARGHRYTLKSDTVLELTTLLGDETKARMEKGRVLSKVKHLQAKEHFSLETPTAVCAVRGTEFETSAGEKGTLVAVFRGIVGVAALGADQEIAVRAGQMTSVHDGTIEVPRPIPQDQNNTDSTLSRQAKHEVGLDMSRNEVIAAAALEQRLAEYKEGKSLIDVEGKRVRIEEYILRPRADQYKFVVLNERDERLDYFYRLGTFNQTLPTDLSVALRDLSGKFGTTAPDYYLTSYEMGMSNTQDSLKDTASGGHLVKITVDANGDYVLTDPTDAANTHTITAAELQIDNTYKVYNPLTDSYTYGVEAADLAASKKFGVFDRSSDKFKDLSVGDSVWKNRFNSYQHALNGTSKIAYAQSGATNILTTTLDAAYTYDGGFISSVYEKVAGTNDATITIYYGTTRKFEKYRTVLISDEGKVAPESAFASIATGSDYKGELLKWNYEQQISATEFQGRKIDLVVEPKIFIQSGLIE